MNRSLLAGVNALYRMAESGRPSGDRILQDPWAERMVERSLRVRLIRYGRFVVPKLWRLIDELQTTHCVRHRAIDELILAAVDDGVTQVVVLGAGYDMRPYRLAESLSHVRWIEVDHPATQARKLELLARFPEDPGAISPPERVAGDLANMSLEKILAASAFEPRRPTLFVAEGVIHYLPLQAIEALFGAIASGGQPARLVFSYIDRAVYSDASATLVALVRAVRERPLVSFDRPGIELTCRAAGFDLIRTWSLAEQIEAFVPVAARRNRGPSQHVAVASRGLASSRPER